jgi:MipA family protein
MNKSYITLGLITLALASSAVHARPAESASDWKFEVGAATVYSPNYVGDDDYLLKALPYLSAEYKDKFFANPIEGIGYNIINENGWRVGPIVKLAWEREQDGDSSFAIGGDDTRDLIGLGDVDTTVELGAFAEYTQSNLRYAVELRQGVNGHEGLIGEASISYFDRLSDIFFTVGPRVRFGSADYLNAYWGINASQSASSGLSSYDASGGLISYGIGAFASKPLSDTLSLGVFASYDRLSPEVADSPLVRERGSANQFMAGASLTYEF